MVLLIREVMYCKPGKVRPLVEKFLAMSKVNEKLGMGKMRVMTDFCAERYWTIVSARRNFGDSSSSTVRSSNSLPMYL